ncbi:hypothetical protein KP79_PYT24235 [Mizuhopecten yessoensis]|uniref:Uncharacterized protein n=1 Tax=Mizuhopecten yessoensis TaxID=6573 RepID=A0A210QR97_MIZYE|nr:hypothetical protein KP79_PYT24235 [Mizuhopecten yessoensis]
MDVYNQCAVNKLERWSRDPSGLITGTETIWHGAKGRSVYDDYMERIAVKFARNDLLISLLKEMVQAGGAKLVSHAEEHLPDGIYANPSTQAISAFNSIGDVTNDIIESTFGMTAYVSSLIAVKRDKPVNWIFYSTLDVDKVCEVAMKSAKRKRYQRQVYFCMAAKACSNS